MHHCAKFCQNRWNICWDIVIFRFLRCQLSAILDLFATFLDHPRSIFGVLYCCAKFGWNHSVFSIIWKFEYFTRLAWKCVFTLPKYVFWEIWPPKLGRYINIISKRLVLAWKDIIWHIDRQNAWLHDQEIKKAKERNLTVANWLFTQTTHVVRL